MNQMRDWRADDIRPYRAMWDPTTWAGHPFNIWPAEVVGPHRPPLRFFVQTEFILRPGEQTVDIPPVHVEDEPADDDGQD